MSSVDLSVNQRRMLTGLAFVSPWLVGFAVLVLYPFLASLYWSFCRYDLLSEPRWVGTAHYQRLAREIVEGREFGEALWNTGYYAMLVVPGSVVLGVGLALLLTDRSAVNAARPGLATTSLRTLFFLPTLVPTVATAILWTWLLDPTRGLVARLLRPLGLAPNWFNSPAEAFNLAAWFRGTAGLGSKDALALMGLWGVGNFVVIYLAALSSVPRELYEAAELDGAGRWSRFRHVTLPHLTPVIFFNVVMGLVAAVQFFTQAYIVGDGLGNPGGSTRVLSLHVFLWAFKYLEAGYASACAWTLFVVVVGLTWLLFRSSRLWVRYGV